MAWAEALLTLSALGLLVAAGLRVRRLDAALQTEAEDQRVQAALMTEIHAMARLMRQIGEVQKFAESALDLSTSTVQTVHRTIADVPFGILESLPATRQTTRRVRDAHDVIAGAVYDAIRGVNRFAGKAARGVFDPPKRPRPGSAKTSADGRQAPGSDTASRRSDPDDS